MDSEVDNFPSKFRITILYILIMQSEEAREMALQMLAAMPDGSSLIPGTFLVVETWSYKLSSNLHKLT